ncbi:hypothetical protein C8R43DRAFT_1135196 [Mycena crocata]|nr:hypothetical protein C8R43DRAFT_1135196 [Mycena crocata]
MSDQPNRAPFTSLYSPELGHDSHGNLLYRDHPDGRWLLHNGPLPNSRQAMQQLPAPAYTAPSTERNRGGLDSPMGHVPDQDRYSFSLRPVQSSAPAQNTLPIDPALLPLPGGADLDLTNGLTIANARGLKRAEKVAGCRCKGKDRTDPKGKKRQHPSSDLDDDDEPIAKCGRPSSSSNYSKDDVNKLFDIIEKEQPVGQKGWKVVQKQYNRWAELNGRPYLKVKKPTSSTTCPPEVKRAHELEDLIGQRVSTRDLSNSEFDDSGDASSDNDVEVIDDPSIVVRTAVACRNPTPPLRRKSRPSGANLVTKMSSVFDPEVQKTSDDARSQRTFENTHILTLSQQLHDSQGVAENLRGQNTILQNHVHELERALDRAELRLEMSGITRAGGERDRGRARRRSPSAGYRSHKRVPGIERVRGKIRCERTFPEGGGVTYWVSDPSTEADSDDEDENHNPWDSFNVPRHSRSRQTAATRAISRCRTPTPGPSRLWPLRLSPTTPAHIVSPYRPSDTTHAPAVIGNAVELVVTPRSGPAVALVISPSKKAT